MKLRILLITLFVLLMCQSVYASELPVKVKLNNDFLNDDTEIKSIEGRLFLPLRPIAEAFGGKLEWLPKEGITRVYVGEDTYVFGENVNKKKSASGDLPLETRAHYESGVLMVELRSFTALFDAGISYNKDTHTIEIQKEGAKLPEYAIGSGLRKITYTDKDLITLARLVHIESQGGSLNRSLAVANVVINRVLSQKFASSLNGVIYQRGQFPPTRSDRFAELQPEATALRAAKLALEGYNNIGDCLYFNHRPFSWKDKEDLYKVIEGMFFYR